MLPQYLPQSLTLNSSRALPNPIVMPTPPVISRKRKRAHQYTVSYSKVQEVDEEGRVREVIVIEDTPPPSTISPATTHTNVFSASYQPPVYSAPIRTRARAAAEAQTLSASTSSAAIVTPAPKKREREPADDSRTILTKKTAAALHQQQPVASTKSWASGSGLPRLMYVIIVRSAESLPLHTHVSFRSQTGNGNIPCDDKEGHYIIVPDDIIYNRYRTVRLLGQGTFGKVVEAVDIHNQDRVAIKIIRAIPKYCDASKIEIRVLQKLKERDPSNVQQLLGSVAFLHDLHLIHTDSTTQPSSPRGTIVRLRLFLGAFWWNSTLASLCIRHDNLEHLAMIEMVMGKKPDRFAHLGARVKPEFFKDDTRLDWPKPKASRQSKKDVRATRPLQDVIPPTDQINKQFVDLVRRLLAFDPAQRITVRDTLHHPYFSLNVPEEL
ncbi:kinase-like domain-containing protein [Suillus subluteus]|nr:kinase-like domain-containing protein [Suillus subluteus]